VYRASHAHIVANSCLFLPNSFYIKKAWFARGVIIGWKLIVRCLKRFSLSSTGWTKLIGKLTMVMFNAMASAEQFSPAVSPSTGSGTAGRTGSATVPRLQCRRENRREYAGALPCFDRLSNRAPGIGNRSATAVCPSTGSGTAVGA